MSLIPDERSADQVLELHWDDVHDRWTIRARVDEHTSEYFSDAEYIESEPFNETVERVWVEGGDEIYLPDAESGYEDLASEFGYEFDY